MIRTRLVKYVIKNSISPKDSVLTLMNLYQIVQLITTIKLATHANKDLFFHLIRSVIKFRDVFTIQK